MGECSITLINGEGWLFRRGDIVSIMTKKYPAEPAKGPFIGKILCIDRWDIQLDCSSSYNAYERTIPVADIYKIEHVME